MKKALPVVSVILAVALIVVGIVCIKQNKVIKDSEFLEFNSAMFYCRLMPDIESEGMWEDATAVLRVLSERCNVPDNGDNLKLLRMCNLLSNLRGADPARPEIQQMLDHLTVSWDTKEREATVVSGDIDGLIDRLSEVLEINE